MHEMQREATIFRFSIDQVPERDRVAVFREEFGRKFLRLDFEFSQDAPLRAQFFVRPLPGLVIARYSVSPMVTRRTRALIAPDEDDFFFAISLAEETNVVQRNRAISCRRGDAFLGSCAEPGDASRSRPGRTLSLRLPRAALAALVPALDDVTLRPISRNIEALQLLRSYLGVLDDSHAIKTPELRQAVVAHIHELIALAVTGPADTAGNERRGVRAARLHTLKSDVLARLSQTILTAKTVARAHGMSDRYVHLLFEETGQTFGDFVEEQRMKRAFELLTDPARAEMRISDIAAEVGYAELSTFDRAFRRWFGDTPSGIRGKP